MQWSNGNITEPFCPPANPPVIASEVPFHERICLGESNVVPPNRQGSYKSCRACDVTQVMIRDPKAQHLPKEKRLNTQWREAVAKARADTDKQVQVAFTEPDVAKINTASGDIRALAAADGFRAQLENDKMALQQV